MKQIAGCIILLLVVASLAYAQPKQEEPVAVKWYSIEEAAALQAKTPKKIFVDVYADWCGPCKMMDRQTFTDPKVAAYLNKYYYPVKFNSEQREPVTIGGRTFVFRSEYKSARSPGLHEYAIALLIDENNPGMGFPSTVYIDEKGQKLQMISGFLVPDIILPILVFFGEDYYKKMSWEAYEKDVWPIIKK